MGHFFRSLEIARALEREKVIFVAGGERPDQEIPSNIKYCQLPGLAMDEHFGALMPTEPDRDLEEVKAERTETLFRIFEKERPDVFLIELFPFGRKAFRFELIPLLDAIKEDRFGHVKVVCSLRDILVERDDGGKHEARVIKYLNKYFDMLLIHSDPAIASLEETFGNMEKIEIPCRYTGFAARKPLKGARREIRDKMGLTGEDKLLIASAGGGKVGGELMSAVLDGFSSIKSQHARLLMLTGPFLDSDAYENLCNRAEKNTRIKIKRFAPDFTNLLMAGDAMVSMAGYNTCMDILASGIPAAVYPFSFNREQTMRAEKISRHIRLDILKQEDLAISRMEDIINNLLIRNRTSPDHGIDLNGAGNSAEIIRKAGNN
ncbi:glycosyltransferase [Maridesulfovibrio sp.]|uniref:glycosyltransferase family protein n=1 Tax=Maridesulfovibrio sp. TaxID=2795000 RepID=UPI002A186B57|nr:glycosyltransferase [Maridesulfovibrio sp.]